MSAAPLPDADALLAQMAALRREVNVLAARVELLIVQRRVLAVPKCAACGALATACGNGRLCSACGRTWSYYVRGRRTIGKEPDFEAWVRLRRRKRAERISQ